MGKGAAVNEETPYEAAEMQLGVPPARERGRRNENPLELSVGQLIRDDFETHERRLFEQGTWAVANHRFGNWRMGVESRVRRGTRGDAAVRDVYARHGFDAVGGGQFELPLDGVVRVPESFTVGA